MASFCAHCGTPLAPNTSFCPACGTPIASAPAADPQLATVAPVPEPVSFTPLTPVPVEPAVINAYDGPQPSTLPEMALARADSSLLDNSAVVPEYAPVNATPIYSPTVGPDAEPAARPAAISPRGTPQPEPIAYQPAPIATRQPGTPMSEPPARGSKASAPVAAGIPGPAPVGGSSSPILKIVLICGAVVLLLILAVGSLIGYKIYTVAKGVKNSIQASQATETTVTTPGSAISTKGSAASITTALGTISSGLAADASSADVGVPIYPGATARQGGLNMKSKSGSFLTVVYKTPDDADKVAEFYRGKLTNADETGSSFNHVTVFKVGSTNDHTMVSVTPKTDDEGSHTDIVIMRTTSPISTEP